MPPIPGKQTWTDLGPAPPPPSRPCPKSPCHHPAAPQQLPRQVGSPIARPLITNTSQTSHPAAAQHSSPQPRGGDPGQRRREQGAPFPPPGKAVAFAAVSSCFPSNTGRVFAWPRQTHNPPRELGQDQDLKSCTASTDTRSHHHSQHMTSSPASKKQQTHARNFSDVKIKTQTSNS